jgi:small subunit ribosomal protein S20
VANIKSAQKRARQAEKTRKHNMGLRSRMRTAYKAAVPVIDTMVNKGIVNKNKAARHKSRLNKRVKEMTA